MSTLNLEQKTSWTKEEQENLYASGFSSYTSGNFAQASTLFSSLVLASPFEERYWRGLASAQQMQARYEEALRAWAMVALIVDNDPLPHFHAAECLTSLHDREEALKALTMAEGLLKEGEAELRDKIELLKRIHNHER